MLPQKPLATVDLSGNETDIRPVLTEAMECIKQRKAQNPNSPLIVTIAENHHFPLFTFLELALLQKCIDQGYKTSFAMEMPHDILPEYGRNMYGLIIPPADNEKFVDHDAEGKLLLKHSIVCPRPYAHEFIYEYCLQNSVAASFNDASVDTRLNEEDPMTFRMMQEFNHQSGLDSCDPMANDILDTHLSCRASRMGVRNAVMVQNTKRQITRQTPDIIIHVTGFHHMYGSKDAGYTYQNSFDTRLKKSGLDVLSIAPSYTSFPDDADLSTSLIIDGWEMEPAPRTSRYDRSLMFQAFQELNKELGNIVDLCAASDHQRKAYYADLETFYDKLPYPKRS